MSNATVSRDLAALEEVLHDVTPEPDTTPAPTTQPSTVTGADGKTYPAKPKKPTTSKPAPTPTPTTSKPGPATRSGTARGVVQLPQPGFVSIRRGEKPPMPAGVRGGAEGNAPVGWWGVGGLLDEQFKSVSTGRTASHAVIGTI